MTQKIYDPVGKFGWYSLLEGSDRAGYGNTWFVDANGSGAANNSNAGTGASWASAFLTLNYAISRCSDDASDVIFVAANHTENWSTAETSSGATTTGCCADKNGITIIGLGVADRRPTFTFTAAAGTLYVDATEVTIYNLIFYSNYVNHASHIDAQSGADGLLVEGCKFYDASAITESVSGIILTANCSDVTIRGNKFYNVDTNDGSDEAILCEGASLRLKVIDNVFDGDWNEEVINMNTAASTEIEVVGNYCNNVDAGFSCFISTHGSCTGVIADNTVYCPAAGSAGGVIADTVCMKANNRITTDLSVEGGDSSIDTSGLHQVYYLDSGTGTDTNDGKTWGTAFATVGAAIDACTADNGDIIYVAAGHAQTLTGADTTTEMDVDCNGISIIGIGRGEDRPTFTMDTDTANANCYVTGVDCLLENLKFVCAQASLENLLDLNGDGLTIRNCVFTDDGTDEPLACITCDTGDGVGDRLMIEDCLFDVVTGDTDWGIHINKDLVDVTVQNCTFTGEYDVACIYLGSAAHVSSDIKILNNRFSNIASGIPLVLFEATGVAITGQISGNVFVNDTRDEIFSPMACASFDNKWFDIAGNAGASNGNFDDPSRGPGEILFVDSGATRAVDGVGNGKSWAEPFATVDYAVAFCTASSGAEIHVAPGHAETLNSAGANITLDVIGVKIIGHGTGTDRPTFTFATEVTADIEVDAANCSIENCIFINDITGLDAPFDVDAAGFTLKNCITRDLGTDICDNWIYADAAADYLTIEGCVHEGTASANGVTWLAMSAACDFLTVKDCVVSGNFSAACIDFAAAVGSVDIDNCSLLNSNAVDVCFEGFAASTGAMRNCSLSILTDGETTAVNTPGAMSYYENYYTDNPVGEAGIICAAAGMTGA